MRGSEQADIEESSNPKKTQPRVLVGSLDKTVPGHKLKVAEPIDWTNSRNRAINAVSIANDLIKHLDPCNVITKDIYAGAIHIVTSGLASSNADYYEVDSSNPVDAEGAQNIIKEDREKQAVIKKSMALACATKVNWFLIDHHIGQKRVTECVTKVFRSFYGVYGHKKEKYTRAVWRYAYLLDTKLALKAIKFMDHEKGDPAASYLETVSPEIKPFAHRFPAGAAVLGVAESALDLLTKRDLWDQYTNKEFLDRVSKLITEVKADKVSYHVRAESLGIERKTFSFDESDKMEASAIILAIAPDSKLARSRVVIKDDSVYALDSYTSLRHAISLRKKGANRSPALCNKI